MKLLILTQKVDKNDDVLGFFHRWIIEFAKKFEKVIVICLYEGQHDLPANVRVFSLGKEDNLSRATYLIRFFKYIWQYRNQYDSVFVHMNQAYVILGGILWRILGKKIGFWYVHRQVTFSLRIAALLTNKIFTSGKESFGLINKKVNYIGHGIDVKSFACPITLNNLEKNIIQIIHVGRITPIKHCEVLIEALKVFRDEKDMKVRALFVGQPMNESDRCYFLKLQKMIADYQLHDQIDFVGSVANIEVREYFWQADLSVNMCPTGGMDKAVLESMAAGVPVFASNKIFTNLLGEDFIFEFAKPRSLVEKVSNYLRNHRQINTKEELIKKVSDFDISRLIDRIFEIYSNSK